VRREEPVDDDAPLFDWVPQLDPMPVVPVVPDELPRDPMTDQELALEIARMLRDGELPY
jgi:hypothetical protein